MYTKVFFLGLLLVALVSAQTSKKDVLIIDPFSPNTDVIVVVVTSDTTFPQINSQFTQSQNILGGERDLELQVISGSIGRVITTGVSNGTWDVSTPSEASSVVTMQYDGVDGTSVLNPQGLAGTDITANNADSFRLNIITDIETTYTINVYSVDNGFSSFDLVIEPSETAKTYFAAFSSFAGNANFQSIGALEIVIAGGDNVDTNIDVFATSATSTPPTSPTATPAPSASPAAVGFTWYTVDDDFGREPCEDEFEEKSYFQTQQNIIYYYFYRAYYEQPIIYINNAANIAPYLFGTLAVIVALF